MKQHRYFTVISDKCKQHSMNYGMVCRALMGLIYHFKNREWITDHSYTYICQNAHGVTFPNEARHDSFMSRLTEDGIAHLIDVEVIEPKES